MADLNVPPTVTHPLNELAGATKANRTATLAAAIITASGRPWSIKEAVERERDISYALYPLKNQGNYQKWAETSEEALAKVHK